MKETENNTDNVLKICHITLLKLVKTEKLIGIKWTFNLFFFSSKQQNTITIFSVNINK